MSLSLLTSGTNHANYSKENNQSAEEFIFYQVRHDLLKEEDDKAIMLIDKVLSSLSLMELFERFLEEELTVKKKLSCPKGTTKKAAVQYLLSAATNEDCQMPIAKMPRDSYHLPRACFKITY